MSSPIDRMIDAVVKPIPKRPQIVLQCPRCKKTAEADRHRLDPKRAVRAVIICPDCDDGDFHEITHFDAEGRALNPATGKPFGLSAKPWSPS